MKILTAIIDDNKVIDTITQIIETYFPSLTLEKTVKFSEWYNSSIKKIPQIVFLNPNSLTKDDIRLISSRPKFIEIIFVLNPNAKYLFPLSLMNPIGYLVQPINKELSLLTIEHAKTIISLKQEVTNSNYFSKLGIPLADEIEYINKQDIIRCESLTGCTKVILSGSRKNIVSSYNIGVFKKMLDAPYFFSPHKSHLINIQYVQKYRREGVIIMKEVKKIGIPVAKNKRQAFLSLIQRI